MISFDKIEAVFFDADDTLYKVRESIGAHYSPIFNKHGLQASVKEVNEVASAAWVAIEEDYYNEKEHYHTSHERDSWVWRLYVEQVLGLLNLSVDETKINSLYADLHKLFATAHSRQLNDFVVDFLVELNVQGYTTGVFTNNDRRIHHLIPDLGVSEHLDYVFCAGDLGNRKPSHLPFEVISDRIKIAPEKILYIGDNLDVDYFASKKAGWNALWYNRAKKEILEDVLHVHCFSEILELLKSSATSA